MVDRYGFSVAAGDVVYWSNGERFGSVTGTAPDSFTVTRDGTGAPAYEVPLMTVASTEDGHVALNVAQDPALEQRWLVEPASGPLTTAAGETVAAPSAAAVATWPAVPGLPDATGAVATDGLPGAVTASASPAVITTTLSDGGPLTIAVHEEVLTATKRAHAVRGTRVEKLIPVERDFLDAPVTEERLKIVRRVIDPAAPDGAAEVVEEVLVDIPLRAADLDPGGNDKLVAEIAIRLERIARIKRVTGTVRRERLTVRETHPGAVTGESVSRARSR